MSGVLIVDSYPSKSTPKGETPRSAHFNVPTVPLFRYSGQSGCENGGSNMDRNDKRIEKPVSKNIAKAPSPAADAVAAGWARTARETIESIVIAFVLAFLFRTFEAEAFVIPTGSMAPTLMGRHLDLNCPKCGYTFRAGASREEEDVVVDRAERRGPDIQTCICPLCRWTIDFLNMTPSQRDEYPYYGGDRILVSKFAFDFTDPQRWDVIVFKFPEDAKTNYIKRLVGLPGEIVRVRDGDIAVSTDGGKTFKTANKPAAKLKATLQIVYDNDYVYEPFIKKNPDGSGGWPARWQDAAQTSGGWIIGKNSDGSENPRQFVTTGWVADEKSPAEAWMRYDNFVPDESDWRQFSEKLPFAPQQPKPITDFIAYDMGTKANQGPSQVNEVSDLAIETQVEVKAAEGQLVLELSKKGKQYQCHFDLSTGAIKLTIPGRADAEQPAAQTGGIAKAGSYRILFADIDRQLTVTVNDKQVTFDRDTAFDQDGQEPEVSYKADVPPARIGSIGAPLAISHLRLWRDVYYSYLFSDQNPAYPSPNYGQFTAPSKWPADSNDWRCFPVKKAAVLAESGADVRKHDQFFFVGDNQFFAMGDNSPLSSDGRLWVHQHFVDRKLLVGKALFIYWPHGFYKLPWTNISLPWPFIPNFSRMGFVR